MPFARTGETVGDDRHSVGWFCDRLVDVHAEIVAIEFDDLTMQEKRCALGRCGGTEQECDRQRKSEQLLREVRTCPAAGKHCGVCRHRARADTRALRAGHRRAWRQIAESADGKDMTERM